MDEDWGDNEENFIQRLMRRFSVKQWLIIGFVVIFSVTSVAYAAIKITSPASNPVNVNTAPTLSQPITNTTNCYIGDTIQITETISPTMEGQQIFFYANVTTNAKGTTLGSAYTNSDGVAILNTVVNTAGTYVYVCDAIIT